MQPAGLAHVAMHRLRGGSTAAATGRTPIASPAADVLICDGLHLPYRPCSCDAVVCIAVLHHIGSKGRRLRLLRALAAVLVPGGRGLVTVWATEQEDPDKTIRKWCKIRDGEGTTAAQQQQQQGLIFGQQQQQQMKGENPGCQQGQQQNRLAGVQPQQRQQQQRGNEFARQEHEQQRAAACEELYDMAADEVDGRLTAVGDAAACSSSSAAAAGGGGVTGPDYMVPWHLPFHKAAGLGLIKPQQQQRGSAAPDAPVAALAGHEADISSRNSSQSVGQTTGQGTSQVVAGVEGIRIDEAKGAVVLQRYYHLFEQYELDGLVQEIPGLKVVDSFYDRSNWCVIFQKQ